MTKHILYNLASRSRPQRLFETIDRIEALANDHNHTILVKIDIDDRCDYSRLLDYKNTTIRISRSNNKVHAINRDIPATGWDILVNVSDDIRFTAKGFDDIIREHCGEDDFVLFPEPYADGQVIKGKNERISVMSVIGHQYYERDKCVYFNDFKSVFCDNFATRLAEIRDCLKTVEIPIFYHEHPTAGYAVNDAQYRHTESYWNEDKKTYYSMINRLNAYK